METLALAHWLESIGMEPRVRSLTGGVGDGGGVKLWIDIDSNNSIKRQRR